MIIGKTFVIGHPGKTGGDAILHLCGHLAPRHELTIDSPDDGRKHHFFHRRQNEEPHLGLDKKERYLSFRRLETWLKSYHAHFARQIRLPIDRQKYAQGLIPFFALDKKRTQWSYEPGDALLREYLDLPLSGFIRMEHLKSDLLATLRRHLDLSADEVATIEQDSYRKTSPAVSGWDPQPSVAERRQMRHNNPLWTKFEEELYGEDRFAVRS